MFEAGITNKQYDHFKLHLRIIRFANKEIWTPDKPEACQSIEFNGFSLILLYLGYLFVLATCTFLIEIVYFSSRFNSMS